MIPAVNDGRTDKADDGRARIREAGATFRQLVVVGGGTSWPSDHPPPSICTPAALVGFTLDGDHRAWLAALLARLDAGAFPALTAASPPRQAHHLKCRRGRPNIQNQSSEPPSICVGSGTPQVRFVPR
jgi:hypothetical protein